MWKPFLVIGGIIAIIWASMGFLLYIVVADTDWNSIANSTGQLIGEVQNGIETGKKD